MLCASAIFRLAAEDDSRDLVRLHGGLELLGNQMQMNFSLFYDQRGNQ